ncbi:Scytalone dehydratase plus inhibitor [Apiospora arundinis]
MGTGERIALTKLAVDHLEKHGRPLRLAIDISIWQFQVQAARGGSNPAVRTLFYRLLRLLSLSIHPIFVFDGPNKPAFKRNKRSGRGDGVATAMAKRLLRLFGYQIHDAPGEAEAECALLQQRGIVDAVLSEDVDTIMFGCTKTWRNWSAEGTKGSKTPTHVSVYDTDLLRQGESGLDREGMVLVALMSGGDYIPEGIPGAGVKLACEAARAGFGKSLCLLKRSDTSKLDEWRDNLIHQLRTNESKFFRTKHKALAVPEDFPNIEVLRYYTHPVVSPSAKLDQLRSQKWGGSLDVPGLREFVRETFDWTYQAGAIKFIRVLAPGLLTRKIMDLSQKHEDGSLDFETLEKEELSLVRSITKTRLHFSTDATPELRLTFIPTHIVGYNFEEEPEEEINFARDGLALNSDDEFEAAADEDSPEATAKPGSRKPYSPNEMDALWTPTTVAKLGIPIMTEDWEGKQRAKESRKKAKAAPKSKSKTAGVQAGALDRYVRVTKSSATTQVTNKEIIEKPVSTTRSRSPLESVTYDTQRRPSPPPPTQKITKPQIPRPQPTSRQQAKTRKSSQAQPPKPDSCVNPWTIAGQQHSPKANKTKATASSTAPTEVIDLSSSPPAPSRSPIRDTLMQQKRAAKPTSPVKLIATSPHKKRSISPSSPSPTRRGIPERSLSPTPRPHQDRRKLARTESMPASPSMAPPSTRSSISRRGGLERVQSDVLADQTAQSIESDSDDDIPPLSRFFGRSRQNPLATASFTPSSPEHSTPASPKVPKDHTSVPISSHNTPMATNTPITRLSRTTDVRNAATVTASKPAGKQQQSKLNNGMFGMRTTKKVYKPRKSIPGYFREVEMSIEEAEFLGEADNHELSLIDLTGEQDD